jgi:hypothetical protein
MNVAAFVISACGFLISVLGLWISLRATRAGERSATASERSAIAARQAVRESRKANNVTAQMLDIERRRYDAETSAAEHTRTQQQSELYPELGFAFIEAKAVDRYATQSVRSRAAYGSLFSSRRKRTRYRAALEITNMGRFVIDRLVVEVASVDFRTIRAQADWTFDHHASHTCDRLRPGDVAKVPLVLTPADDADVTFRVVTTTRGVEHRIDQRIAWKFHKHAFVASYDER